MMELTDADLRAMRRIKRQCEGSDLSVENLAVVPEGMADVVREAYERAEREGVDVSELAIARTDDVATIKRDRQRALEAAQEATGLSRSELEGMTLPALKKLADTNNTDPLAGEPDPQSQDPEGGGSVTYSDPAKAEELKQHREKLEGRTDTFSQKCVEEIDRQLDDLRK